MITNYSENEIYVVGGPEMADFWADFERLGGECDDSGGWIFNITSIVKLRRFLWFQREDVTWANTNDNLGWTVVTNKKKTRRSQKARANSMPMEPAGGWA